MGSRILQQGPKVFPVELIKLHGKLVVGASGAVTSFKGYGFHDITKEATAGRYTLVLADPYKLLVDWSVSFLHSSAVAVYGQLISEDVDNATRASRTAVVGLFNLDDDSAADAPDGSTVFITLTVQNSQLGIGPTLT